MSHNPTLFQQHRPWSDSSLNKHVLAPKLVLSSILFPSFLPLPPTAVPTPPPISPTCFKQPNLAEICLFSSFFPLCEPVPSGLSCLHSGGWSWFAFYETEEPRNTMKYFTWRFIDFYFNLGTFQDI